MLLQKQEMYNILAHFRYLENKRIDRVLFFFFRNWFAKSEIIIAKQAENNSM